MTHASHSDENAHKRGHGGNDDPASRRKENTRELSAIAQRTRAVQRLSALGEMTGGIAHDFRNVLAVIASGLKLAEMNSEQPDKAREYIVGAQEAVDRGLKLTSQLLAFARRQELGTHAGDANDSLKKLELFLRYGAGPGIRIVFDLADVPKCLIDASQFDAAILNLVVNARDAMPNGGEIQISTAQCTVTTATIDSPKPGSYVRVRIKDSGQGMAPDVVLKIFEPFFTTKGEKGTGLGLPQVRALMRQIGGHLNVVSQIGSGTTFDLLFPIVASRETTFVSPVKS